MPNAAPRMTKSGRVGSMVGVDVGDRVGEGVAIGG